PAPADGCPIPPGARSRSKSLPLPARRGHRQLTRPQRGPGEGTSPPAARAEGDAGAGPKTAAEPRAVEEVERGAAAGEGGRGPAEPAAGPGHCPDPAGPGPVLESNPPEAIRADGPGGAGEMGPRRFRPGCGAETTRGRSAPEGGPPALQAARRPGCEGPSA